jgi:hypothetical protein
VIQATEEHGTLPHLNVALREEILYYTRQGIEQSVRRSAAQHSAYATGPTRAQSVT